MGGAQSQGASEVGGAAQHGASGCGVDDDGEVPRQDPNLGRAPGDPSSPSAMANAETELGDAVEDAAGEAVGEEAPFAVELRGHADGREPAQERGLRLRLEWGWGGGRGRWGGRGGAFFVHGRGREEGRRRHAMRRDG